MKSFTRAALALAAVTGAAASVAKADAPNLSGFPAAPVLTAAATGNVTVTFLFSRASFTNYLVLFNSIGGTGTTIMTVPGNYPNVGVPQPGVSVDIPVTAGQTLLFGLCTQGTTGGETSTACTSLGTGPNTTWYVGALNNTDGNHVKLLTDAQWNALNNACQAESPACNDAPAGTSVLGFEDKPLNNPDTDEPDYNDIVFAFSNVSTVPEPATMGLLAIGLAGMSGAGLLRRRNRKNTK